MAKTLDTKLEIKSWDEKPYRELADGQKYTRADVVHNHDSLDAASESLMYYAPDGSTTYVGLMHISGNLDGKSGSFALRSTGTYDGTTARTEYVIVPGSGTGELAGITGTGESVSTHDDYPNMPFKLRYELG
jgi:hypothetical protein